MEQSVFQKLNAINVQDHVEKKNGLSYLSWAWAWSEVKKVYPNANYKIYERQTEWGEVNYFTDGRTCWVKTGVEINGLEHIEELPVMDFRNKSIPLDKVTSFDVNKAIQRSLTKALARHGLGLYIYAGEDLPETDKQKEEEEALKKVLPVYTQLRTQMESLGIDFRGEYNQWICEKADVHTQNNTELNLEQLNRVIKVYKTLIKGWQAKHE